MGDSEVERNVRRRRIHPFRQGSRLGRLGSFEALEEGSVDQFLLALRHVAEAHGGLGVISQITELNRQSMYRMLSDRGNPTLSSLLAVLRALGIDIAFRPIGHAAA